jgi:hypothetical protein
MRFSKSTFCCACFLLVLLAVLLIPAFGSFQPSFGLDYCSWNATHIVLAEVTPQDGSFKVIESWKGSLNAGDHVSVSQLEPGPHAIPIALYSNQSRYEFTQWMNPGPSLLSKWDKSLAAVHARVAEIIQMQKALNDSVALAR